MVHKTRVVIRCKLVECNHERVLNSVIASVNHKSRNAVTQIIIVNEVDNSSDIVFHVTLEDKTSLGRIVKLVNTYFSIGQLINLITFKAVISVIKIA